MGESLASPTTQDQGANNRTLLNAAERAADPDRYTSWKGQFPDLSQFYGQPWAGDAVAQAVDRSQDIQLAAAKGYDGIGLGKATTGDEPGTVQFNTLRGAGYRKRINFDGTTQEYYVLDPVEVTGQSLRSMSASAAPRVLTMPAMDSSVSFLQAADLAPLSGGVTMQDLAPLPTMAMTVQSSNDAKAIAGTLNIFGEALGAAWQGNWEQAWAHLNYEPSEAVRAAVNARMFPGATLLEQRVDAARGGVTGAAFVLMTQGRDAHTQMHAAQVGSLIDGVAGSFMNLRSAIDQNAALRGRADILDYSSLTYLPRGRNGGNFEGLRWDLAESAGIPRYIDLAKPSNVWGMDGRDLLTHYRLRGFSGSMLPVKSKTSGLAQVFELEGHPDISMVQYHPGGGRAHAGSYYKFGMRDGSEIKVIDPMTCIPRTIKDRSTFFNPQGQQIVFLNGQWVVVD